VSVGWGEVADVQRAGRDIVVSLEESRRLLGFSCYSAAEAARGGVIAQYLASCARPHAVDPPPSITPRSKIESDSANPEGEREILKPGQKRVHPPVCPWKVYQS
jgi:uncharacterized protein YuzE